MVLLQSHQPIYLASEPREVVKVLFHPKLLLVSLKGGHHEWKLKEIDHVCINFWKFWVGFFNVFTVVKDHVRPKFSFHSHTHGETSSKISDMAENFEPAADQVIEDDPIAECTNEFDERSENGQGISVAESREVLYGCTEDAIPKLLDIPPDKIRLIKRSSELVNLLIQWISNWFATLLSSLFHSLASFLLQDSRHEGKSRKFAHKGSSSNFQVSDTDDELPGPMDSGSSSDDEVSISSFLVISVISFSSIYNQILKNIVLLHSLVIQAQCRTFPTRRNNLLETALMKQ